MSWQPNIKSFNGKPAVFCDWRRKFVRLTPEEKVRQTFLHLLVEDYAYPHNLIAVEHSITVGAVHKRCDAVVFSSSLQPLCIIEFKAPDVPVTQHVFDQVLVYNHRLHVPCLIVSNGNTTHVCRINGDASAPSYTFLPTLPCYEELLSVNLFQDKA